MARASASKDPYSGMRQGGSPTPLQPMIKSNGRMVDDRMAPCGDNLLVSPDDDGDEY